MHLNKRNQTALLSLLLPLSSHTHISINTKKYSPFRSPPRMSRPTLAFFVAAMMTMMVAINGQDVGTPSGENKCGGCPCNSPCTYPSPPPPYPSPPPPSPPPPKKPPTPSTPYCPPPPGSVEPTPPSYIYITGPPGEVYHVDPNFNGATGGEIYGTVLFLIIAGAMLQLAL